VSLIIPTGYLQQKATASQRGSRRGPTGFLQRGRAPSAPLRALSTAVAAPTACLRLIPCPRVIAALLAPPPSSGAVVAPPGLPPAGSLRRLPPRAPRVRPGSLRRLGGVLPAPVLGAPSGARSAPLLAALLLAPGVLGALPPPRGSPQMARQGSPQRLGARPCASPCGLAAPSPPSLRVAIASQRGSRRVPAVRVASPGLHGSGYALRFTYAPCAPLRSPNWCHARLRSASAVSARLRRFVSFLHLPVHCARIGLRYLAIRSCPRCRSIPSLLGSRLFRATARFKCSAAAGSRPSAAAPTARCPRAPLAWGALVRLGGPWRSLLAFPAPFGRAPRRCAGLRESGAPVGRAFLSATRGMRQTWLVSATHPQRRGLTRHVCTPQKPHLPFLRHSRAAFVGS